MSPSTNWWNQPDRFDWTTRFLRQRGLLRSAQRIMAVVAGCSALVVLGDLVSRPLTAPAAAVVVAASLLTLGLTALWLTRWPTRRQSLTAVMVGVGCIAAWSVSQPNSTVAALACTVTAVTGGYIAFFHGPKPLVVNVGVALVIASAAATRLYGEAGLQAAVQALWLIWFLNVSVPLAIWGTSQAMSRYVERSDEDPLTGLLNRRGFIEAITRRLVDPEPGITHLTVQMVDLDDFKHVNDTHGHAVGDRVLKAVAELLRNHVPASALICRAGGEEFLIASTSTSTSATDQAPMAAALCAAISDLSHSITASIGSAIAALDGVRPEAAPTVIEELIAAADTAMYSAKRNGGNQVRHA